MLNTGTVIGTVTGGATLTSARIVVVPICVSTPTVGQGRHRRVHFGSDSGFGMTPGGTSTWMFFRTPPGKRPSGSPADVS